MKEISCRLTLTSTVEYPLIYHINIRDPEHNRQARLSLYECTAGREPCLLNYTEEKLNGGSRLIFFLRSLRR